MSECELVPVNVAVMTVSDSRTEENDTSGSALVDKLTSAGHKLVEKCIIADDVYKIRETISRWIASSAVDVIITTGGTGLTGRDITPEAIRPLLDKEIEGVGELFRLVSYEEIGTSTIASRAFGGVANGTFVFCLPGSTGACRTGWDKVIGPQLDSCTTPCNVVALMPRLLEK
jgi:molybdenum cofactor biosynthesis protein B